MTEVREWWNDEEAERELDAELDAEISHDIEEAEKMLRQDRPELFARADAGDEEAEEELQGFYHGVGLQAAFRVMGEHGMEWQQLDPEPEPVSNN